MWVFSGSHGQATSACPGASGAPTEWRQGTNSPSAPSASSGEVPILVMMAMFTTTSAESVSWTPIFAWLEPTGPIENGTTYRVRPRIAPENSPVSLARISSGSDQLFVGPASTSRAEQMNVRASTRAVSRGSERAR